MAVMQRLWALRFTILTLVILQVFDLFSTLLAIDAGGTEDNPVMARALANGPVGLWLAKLAVIALVFVGVALSERGPYVPAGLLIMNVVYGVVLSLNFASYAVLTGDWMLAVAFWGLMLSLAIVAVNDAFFQRRPNRSKP